MRLPIDLPNKRGRPEGQYECCRRGRYKREFLEIYIAESSAGTEPDTTPGSNDASVTAHADTPAIVTKHW